MKRLFALIALFISAAAFALGTNGSSTNLTLVNANANAGPCTAGSCAVASFQIPLSGATIFTAADAKYGTLSVQVLGTWVGTITFQYSQDEGATWNSYPIYVFPLSTGTGPPVTTTTANGNWVAPTQGITTFRAVFTAFTSGTAVVVLETGMQPVGKLVYNDNALPFFNDAVAGTVVQIKGTRGVLKCLNLVNTTAAVAYLQIFFLPSASVTLGTTVADLDVRLLASAALTFCPLTVGTVAGSGISVAGTTTATGSTGAAISVGATYQ